MPTATLDIQRYDADGRSDSGNQVTRGETHRPDNFFQRRTEHIEREKIEGEMEQIVVQEKSGEEPPKLAFVDDGEVIERAESMQSDQTGQRSSPKYDTIRGEIKEDENDHSRHVS